LTEKKGVQLRFTTDSYAALITWLVLGGVCGFYLAGSDSSALQALIVVSLFAVYGLAFIVVAGIETQSKLVPLSALSIELLSAYGLFFIIPLDYIAILLVIWSAQVTWFLSFRTAIATALLASVPFLASRYYLQGQGLSESGVIQSWGLFALFNCFAVVMIHLTRNEQQAREQANAELEAARAMLSEAGKRAEEMRLKAIQQGPVHLEPLTGKEKEILRLAASGCNNKEIAEALYNSEGTIKNSFSVILGKLGVADRTQAVVKALWDDIKA